MTLESAGARFFEAVAPRYDRTYALPAEVTRGRIARVVAELPPAPSEVLDLGVGTGRELSALLDAGYRVTGVDWSASMLERCGRRGRAVPLVLADFWGPKLPFAAASFDAAIALHGTLAHPPDTHAVERLSSELARLVRPGGLFVAEVPSVAWLERAEPWNEDTDHRVLRTGPRTCVCEDTVAGLSIEARLLEPAEWVSALVPAWQPRIEPLGELEWLIVARRAS